MGGELARWIEDKVLALSYDEVIEHYKIYNGKRTVQKYGRARLCVEGIEKRFYLEQDDGKWQERQSDKRWGLRRPNGEPYFLCVARTNLTYKGWTTGPREMVGFLRIGVGGAVLLFANGDRITIAESPYPRAPEPMRTVLTVVNGFLTEASAANPDYPVWEAWAAEIAAAQAEVRARADERGRIINIGAWARKPEAFCSCCSRHVADDEGSPAIWRVALGKLYCPTCGAREL